MTTTLLADVVGKQQPIDAEFLTVVDVLNQRTAAHRDE